MDLGLSAVTDDQLLELLKQACDEIVRRDPIIRNLAQQTITTAAERRATTIAMGKKAVEAVAGAYIESVRQETFQAVQAGVADGSIRLLTAAQEARVVVEATLEAKIAACNELVRTIQEGKHPPAKGQQTEPQSPRRKDYGTTQEYSRAMWEWENQHRASAPFLEYDPKAGIPVRGPLDPLEVQRKADENLARMRLMNEMAQKFQQIKLAMGMPALPLYPDPAPPVSGAAIQHMMEQAVEQGDYQKFRDARQRQLEALKREEEAATAEEEKAKKRPLFFDWMK